jgi:hypothetical protein
MKPRSPPGCRHNRAQNMAQDITHGAIRTLADLEEITSAWVHWYNTARLMHRLGRRPPAGG